MESRAWLTLEISGGVDFRPQESGLKFDRVKERGDLADEAADAGRASVHWASGIRVVITLWSWGQRGRGAEKALYHG